MKKLVAFLFVMGALGGAAAAWWWLGADTGERPPPLAGEPAAVSRAAVPPDPAKQGQAEESSPAWPRASSEERRPPNPALELGGVPVPPERSYQLRPNNPADPDGESRLPRKIDYPRQSKYRDEQLSRVPHRMVGAWDDGEDAGDLGTRRAFILVVDPGLTDAQLEDLVRDVRERHRDADFLNVRVFDSEEAATTPSHVDGGRFAYSHMVATLRRNTETGSDAVQIRGRAVSP